MAKERSLTRPEAIDEAIKIVRGQRVLLDSDLARLYGVTMAALNQAVRRNPERFPADFAFRLTRQEFTALISQSVISKARRGGRRKLPWVFTEHGVAMLSSVLRSARGPGQCRDHAASRLSRTNSQRLFVGLNSMTIP
jgi:hypothetical protein